MQASPRSLQYETDNVNNFKNSGTAQFSYKISLMETYSFLMTYFLVISYLF